MADLNMLIMMIKAVTRMRMVKATHKMMMMMMMMMITNMRKKIVPISKFKKNFFLRSHREYVLFLTDGPVVRPIWRKFAHF